VGSSWVQDAIVLFLSSGAHATHALVQLADKQA